MVKVEIDHAAAVAASDASATRLSDEDALELLVPSCDGFANTALASPAEPPLSRAVSMEFDRSVDPASPDLRRAVLCRRSSGYLDQGARRTWLLHEHMFAPGGD
jgi:hypothetical protein